MSLEAIERVAQTEQRNQERKTAAEAEAKQIVADAERDGLAFLQSTRVQSEEEGKRLLLQAEEAAQSRTEEIERAAQADAETLRTAAGRHLEEAAEFIVGRVVNH